jgi:hypothetical protein
MIQQRGSFGSLFFLSPMKIFLYVEKEEFDSFYIWFRRISSGIIESQPVQVSHSPDEFSSPLKISLDVDEYYLITDIQEDLKSLDESCGFLSLKYEPDTQDFHLQRIKESLRSAARIDKTNELVYSALLVMQSVPGITPSEAIIIAEKSISE